MQRKLNDLLVDRMKEALLDITPVEIVSGLIEEVGLEEVVAAVNAVAREEKKKVFIAMEETYES